MNLVVPIYVEGNRPGGGSMVYRARPLFFERPETRGEKLDRLMARLTQDLGKHLSGLSKLGRHEELAAYTFYPTLSQKRLDVTLHLRRRTARCRYLFVTFRHLDRRLVFTPSLPEVWFDLERNETLYQRAAEVLTSHFREREKENSNFDPEAGSLSGTAYVTPLEVTIHPPTLPPEQPALPFLFLGQEEKMDGGTELRRVGRCLDWQYPDDLDRLHLRHAELTELRHLLDNPDQRPVLLVGPPKVGKTVLIHEFVFRRVKQRPSPYRDQGNVWLLAPARLISGMSYVGQWENRLLAIVKEAKKRKHVLYFDDLLGLFLAGQTGCSSLTVAALLKPYLERREIRVVAEITPEALRILREQDRGFADLFHILPIAEPTESDTLRILIGVQRQLEAKHHCRFQPEVLPTILDLQRRYARGSAFPGKAAEFLGQLAVKLANNNVIHAAVLQELHLRTGLTFTFLSTMTSLRRQDVINALNSKVVGQDEALEAAADVIAVAKARLNDPDRPLASFLFLGPTGVGKTECAKALATYLFTTSDRLVRFDLNEFNAPGSASRLVGTFSQPEGLLTSAIRRQPFAVILFDEIEKADPEVFDVLLQVLGEGRLTDALGRTVDFSNALIVMTSNLGVRESEGNLGFRQDESLRGSQFVQSAERFFRPEFFNRIDRIIAFHRLTRSQVRTIADRLISDVLQREGLVQRKCFLSVSPAALEKVVDQGYDPVLGARALKRAVERHLTQPIATQLSGLPPGQFTVVRVYVRKEELDVHVQALEQVPALPPRPLHQLEPADVVERIHQALRRIEEEVASLRPTGPVTLGQIRPEEYRYFVVRGQIEEMRQLLRSVAEQIELAERRRRMPSYRRPDMPRGGYKYLGERGHLLRELASALDIPEYLRELLETTPSATGEHLKAVTDLVRESSLLEAIADSAREAGPDCIVLWPQAPPGYVDVMRESYYLSLPGLHLDISRHVFDEEHVFLVVRGPHARLIGQLESGTHLYCPMHGPIQPIRVLAIAVPDGQEPDTAVRNWLKSESDGVESFGPVVRVYTEKPGVLDLRIGLSGPIHECLLDSLPLPPEINEAFNDGDT